MKFKNIKADKTILLVGCGQIGYRHFESLLDNKFIENIDILEKQKINKRIKSKINLNKNIDINFLNNINSLKKNYDLVIFATTSSNTFDIFYKLVKKCTIKNILFEKITFSKLHHYDMATKILERKKINSWVNCSNAYQTYFLFLKKKIKTNKPFNLTIDSMNDNFISNFIHLYDLFTNLSKRRKSKIILMDVYDFYKSKRQGYHDASGRCLIKDLNTNVLYLTSNVDKKFSFTQTFCLSQGKNIFLCDIDAHNVIINYYINNKKFTKKFKHLYQSKLTSIITNDIFNNECKLINFYDYKNLQKEILLNVYKNIKDSNLMNVKFS
jgi:hypothetical protein